MDFWVDEHPIIASPLNVTFHRLISMSDAAFTKWAEDSRQFLGRCWSKKGIPPHNGTSLEEIESEMRRLSLHRTYNFLQKDETTYRRDVVQPDSRYGSFLRCLFTNMSKSGDGNSDGRSLYDYLVAKKKTKSGRRGGVQQRRSFFRRRVVVAFEN